MISRATHTIKLNSSYVLIIITTLRKVSDWARARPPAPWVKILFCFETLAILESAEGCLPDFLLISYVFGIIFQILNWQYFGI